jgi:hypothetical protein
MRIIFIWLTQNPGILSWKFPWWMQSWRASSTFFFKGKSLLPRYTLEHERITGNPKWDLLMTLHYILQTPLRKFNSPKNMCVCPSFFLKASHFTCSLKFLYLWFGHYTRKAGGWRLFDHPKPSVMWGYFSWFFSLFVTFCYFFYCF